MADVNETLKDRGGRYGDFKAHAEITQGLKGVMQETPGWKRLTPSMKESLEMVAHKVGRILNGDPTYADSWHDIAGYASLVDAELTGDATSYEGPGKAAVVAAVTARTREPKVLVELPPAVELPQPTPVEPQPAEAPRFPSMSPIPAAPVAPVVDAE